MVSSSRRKAKVGLALLVLMSIVTSLVGLLILPFSGQTRSVPDFFAVFLGAFSLIVLPWTGVWSLTSGRPIVAILLFAVVGVVMHLAGDPFLTIAGWAWLAVVAVLVGREGWRRRIR